MAGGALVATAAGCGELKEGDRDLVAGKQMFVEKCGSCHKLKRAGTSGTQGPDLDAAFGRALSDGFGRSGVEGTVRDQIEHPAAMPKNSPVYMPADLVKGRDARNVAAYVAASAAKPGEDTGLLASAVKKAGGGKPAVEKNGVVTIPATAQLAFETNAATAKPGQLTLKAPNPSGTPHNIAIEGPGANAKGKVVQDGGVSEVSATVKKGQYTFYCSVPGHREGGMLGKLTVK